MFAYYMYCNKSCLFSLEYIVSFHGYYSSETRDGFIAAALRRFSGWSIVARDNPSQDYPSDFSLVQLKGGMADALEALRHHPSVKRVTPQKKLTRLLTFSGDGECISSRQVLCFMDLCF